MGGRTRITLFFAALCLAFTGAGAGMASAATTTFASPAAAQTFIVPAGVTSLNVAAIGGRGGNGAVGSTVRPASEALAPRDG